MKHFFIYLIRGYQLFISPYFPTSCRYYPTCSHYAIQAFRVHGVLKGLALTVWRILRCNPWTAGGEDLVPGTRSDSCSHATDGSHDKHEQHEHQSGTGNHGLVIKKSKRHHYRNRHHPHRLRNRPAAVSEKTMSPVISNDF